MYLMVGVDELCEGEQVALQGSGVGFLGEEMGDGDVIGRPFEVVQEIFGVVVTKPEPGVPLGSRGVPAHGHAEDLQRLGPGDGCDARGSVPPFLGGLLKRLPDHADLEGPGVARALRQLEGVEFLLRQGH